jgi:hypothetical protein
MIPYDLMIPNDLGRVVDETWLLDLEKGFSKGKNPFFAWLVVASFPREKWPDWVISYLGEVADRVLNSDLNKAAAVLGIKSPKKSWLKASPLIRELKDRVASPEGTDLGRYLGASAHDRKIMELEVQLEFYKGIAGEKGITRLQAREEVADDYGYSSESSHRRGVKRRLKRSRM